MGIKKLIKQEIEENTIKNRSLLNKIKIQVFEENRIYQKKVNLKSFIESRIV